MQDDGRKESRLSRWSKRKIAATRQPETAAVETDESPSVDAEQQARRATELAANREAAEAIDLDRLDGDSDYSVFLKEGVPEILKKRAMAVLWRSNPILANVDGLVDYDDDFGSPDLLMKTFQSAYQVGKGYLEHQEREASSSAEADEAVAADTVADDNSSPPEDDGHSEEAAAEDSDRGDAPESAAVEMPDAEPVEAEDAKAPMPGVSLRRRLQLDPKT